MSISTKNSVCRHQQNKKRTCWFDSLSTGQLKDLCRAAHLSHVSRTRSELVKELCDSDISASFASANVASIKDMCRSRSLSTTGLKYQLVLRVLAHDSFDRHEFISKHAMRSINELGRKMEYRNDIGSNDFCWLSDTIKEIRDSTPQAEPDNIHEYELAYAAGYQSPIGALRDAEIAVLVFTHCCTPNVGTVCHTSLLEAIYYLWFLVVEARVFMSKSEKKVAMKWIVDLDYFLSEFMLDENPEISLGELVKLLENDSYYSPEPPPTANSRHVTKPTRTPPIGFNNAGSNDPNITIDMSSIIMKIPKPKIVTGEKKIVYKKMVRVLRKPGVNSDYVYGKLVRLMKSILSEFDYYKTLWLFRAAFLALIVHFEKMDQPGIDTDHNFTIAVDLLGDVLENVQGALSMKEKNKNIRWMTDLQTLTNPYGLAEIAEKSLSELISMLKESDAIEQETNTRQFFFPI